MSNTPIGWKGMLACFCLCLCASAVHSDDLTINDVLTTDEIRLLHARDSQSKTAPDEWRGYRAAFLEKKIQNASDPDRRVFLEILLWQEYTGLSRHQDGLNLMRRAANSENVSENLHDIAVASLLNSHYRMALGAESEAGLRKHQQDGLAEGNLLLQKARAKGRQTGETEQQIGFLGDGNIRKMAFDEEGKFLPPKERGAKKGKPSAVLGCGGQSGSGCGCSSARRVALAPGPPALEKQATSGGCCGGSGLNAIATTDGTGPQSCSAASGCGGATGCACGGSAATTSCSAAISPVSGKDAKVGGCCGSNAKAANSSDGTTSQSCSSASGCGGATGCTCGGGVGKKDGSAATTSQPAASESPAVVSSPIKAADDFDVFALVPSSAIEENARRRRVDLKRKMEIIRTRPSLLETDDAFGSLWWFYLKSSDPAEKAISKKISEKRLEYLESFAREHAADESLARRATALSIEPLWDLGRFDDYSRIRDTLNLVDYESYRRCLWRHHESYTVAVYYNQLNRDYRSLRYRPEGFTKCREICLKAVEFAENWENRYPWVEMLPTEEKDEIRRKAAFMEVWGLTTLAEFEVREGFDEDALRHYVMAAAFLERLPEGMKFDPTVPNRLLTEIPKLEAKLQKETKTDLSRLMTGRFAPKTE